MQIKNYGFEDDTQKTSDDGGSGGELNIHILILLSIEISFKLH